MYDDYPFAAPDLRSEVNILVDHARRILTAYDKRNDVSGGDGWVEFEMVKLRESMHHLFGDPMPAPVTAPAVTARRPSQRTRRFRRVLAIAS
jgi:hypothetical protein